jgi:hypothetical protein
VHVPDDQLADLRRRIKATRWPDRGAAELHHCAGWLGSRALRKPVAIPRRFCNWFVQRASA